MASLFANRNRRSQRIRNASLSRGAGLRTRASGFELRAPGRGVTGAASGAMQIDAARQGSLIQHKLRQSDQTHGLNMAQGKASLRKQRLGNERYEGATPLHLEGMELDNTGKEKRNTGLGLANTRRQQQIDQADEMNPLLVTNQKAQNRGLRLTNTSRKQRNDEFKAGAGLRRKTRNNRESVADMRGSLLKAEQVGYDERGYLIARSGEQNRSMSPEQAGLAGISLRKPVETGEDPTAVIQGTAMQAANNAIQGGSIDDVLAGVPPEQIPAAREQTKKILLEEAGRLSELPQDTWLTFGKARDATTKRLKGIQEVLRSSFGVMDPDKAIEGYKAEQARRNNATQASLRTDTSPVAKKAIEKEQRLQGFGNSL